MGSAKKVAAKPAARKKAVKPAAKKKVTAKAAAEKKVVAKPVATERAVLVSSGTQPGETKLVVPPPTDAERAGYEAEAKAVDPTAMTLTVPFAVFTGEALDAARFVWNRWDAKREPGTDKVLAPGLELALSKEERTGKKPARISRRFAHEIAHVVSLAQGANNDAILAASAGGDGALDARAELVASEIEAVLDWHFSSDGVLDQRDAQLAQVRETHAKDGESRDELAQRLQDYAALGNTYRDEIDDVGGFDVGLLDEALVLADKLRATPRQPKPNERRMSAIELRNRYVVVAQRRVTLLRNAAQLVFRDHPKVIREVTSTYQRRKRAESRRAKVANKDAKPTPVK